MTDLQTVTPKRQAQIAFICSYLRTDSDSIQVPIGRLNRYVRDLQTLSKLKKTYECVLSYKNYLVDSYFC
jgi:hypothetical protein